MMNSLKIEMGAILSIKNAVFKHRLMHDYINCNDKEPSWDGFIYLYNTADMRVEDIKYRIPVQIKGKNMQSLLKRNGISYQVEYKHLRNYCKDGGVFYIVVIISDDGERASVFYNSLTPIKLKDLLNGTEEKESEQTKNIGLQKLDLKNSDTFYRVLAQFGMDCEKQGRGNTEILKKAINISVIDRVDIIQAASYSAKSDADILKEIATGEVSLYGHRADIDMWFPFDYKLQKDIIICQTEIMYKPLGIDGINYYDLYYVEGGSFKDNKPIIRVSENLTLDIFKGKFHFDAIGNLTTLLRDVRFLNAIVNGKSFYVDGKRIMGFSYVKIPKNLKNELKMISDLSYAFDEIGFVCNKNFSDFTDENWKSINDLLRIYNRNIRLKEGIDNSWYMWYWDEKIVPLFLNRNEKGNTDVVNWFTTEKYGVFVGDDKQYAMPKFAIYKRNVLEKMYDVDEKIWFEEIDRVEFSENNIQEISLFFVELVAAYDITCNEVYYNVAMRIIERILEVLPEDEYGIINKMQLLKRKGELCEKDILILEQIEENSDNLMTLCAVSILLENKRKVMKLIAELPEEKQKEIKGYPIYNLMKNINNM